MSSHKYSSTKCCQNLTKRKKTYFCVNIFEKFFHTFGETFFTRERERKRERETERGLILLLFIRAGDVTWRQTDRKKKQKSFRNSSQTHGGHHSSVYSYLTSILWSQVCIPAHHLRFYIVKFCTTYICRCIEKEGK